MKIKPSHHEAKTKIQINFQSHILDLPFLCESNQTKFTSKKSILNYNKARYEGKERKA